MTEFDRRRDMTTGSLDRRVETLHTALDAAQQAYDATGEEVIQAIPAKARGSVSRHTLAAEKLARIESDMALIKAAKRVPGMTPNLLDQLFKAKNAIEEGDFEQDAAPTHDSNAVAAVLLEEAPEMEVAGLYGYTASELTRVRTEVYPNAMAKLESHPGHSSLLDPVINRALNARAELTEHGTDRLWKETIEEHPDVSSATARDIFVEKELRRDKLTRYFDEPESEPEE